VAGGTVAAGAAEVGTVMAVEGGSVAGGAAVAAGVTGLPPQAVSSKQATTKSELTMERLLVFMSFSLLSW
jgi:hypothetical protein